MTPAIEHAIREWAGPTLNIYWNTGTIDARHGEHFVSVVHRADCYVAREYRCTEYLGASGTSRGSFLELVRAHTFQAEQE